MPQLDPETAKKVDDAESGFKPLDPGVYVVFLTEDVDIKEPQESDSNSDKVTYPYWRWSFEVVEGTPGEGKKLWTNTSLSPAAHFKIKEMFAAFEVPTTTNTKKLVGKRIRVQVGVTTIQKGKRKGELTNEIEQALPLGDGASEVFEDAAPAAPAKKKALF